MDKSDKLKKNLLKALEASMGIVTTACKKVSCSRETFYKYLREDEKFKEQVNSINEMALDFSESKMLELIGGTKAMSKDGQVVYKTKPDVTMIIFHLKTKGKHRGYVERQEIVEHKEQPFVVPLKKAK